LSRAESSSSPESNHNNEPESLFNEIHSNELQTLKKNIDDLNKNKDQLENELTEFRSDLSLLVNNMQFISKKLPINTSALNEQTVINGDIKPTKQALNQFDRLKADLELMIDAYINLNESKNQEDLTKRLDSLKFDNNFVADNLVITFIDDLKSI
jgi:chromosome segregation ATPase